MKTADAFSTFSESLSFEVVTIGGLRTARLSRAALAKLVVDGVRRRQGAPDSPWLMFDSNGQGLAMAADNECYSGLMKSADIIHADGQPIVWASRFLSNGAIPERSATTDMIHDVAKVSIDPQLAWYLLGGDEAVNRTCAERLVELYPGLRIVGRRNGYFSKAETADVVSDINRAAPDIVWVGLGKPKEQAFCVEVRDEIQAAWMISCGGCFNYVAGAYARAPMWMQKTGLEWLFRLLGNPRRFFWRYLMTNPRALFLLLTKTRQDLSKHTLQHPSQQGERAPVEPHGA